jgi:hypothetical protein
MPYAKNLKLHEIPVIYSTTASMMNNRKMFSAKCILFDV